MTNGPLFTSFSEKLRLLNLGLQARDFSRSLQNNSLFEIPFGNYCLHKRMWAISRFPNWNTDLLLSKNTGHAELVGLHNLFHWRKFQTSGARNKQDVRF